MSRFCSARLRFDASAISLSSWMFWIWGGKGRHYTPWLYILGNLLMTLNAEGLIIYFFGGGACLISKYHKLWSAESCQHLIHLLSDLIVHDLNLNSCFCWPTWDTWLLFMENVRNLKFVNTFQITWGQSPAKDRLRDNDSPELYIYDSVNALLPTSLYSINPETHTHCWLQWFVKETFRHIIGVC